MSSSEPLLSTLPADALTPVKQRSPRPSKRRMAQGIVRHMVGFGLYRATLVDRGEQSNVAYPGLDIKVVSDLRGKITRHGRQFVEDARRPHSAAPLVVMDWPKGAVHPDEVMVVMPLTDWIKVISSTEEK